MALGTAGRKLIFPKLKRGKTNIDSQAERYAFQHFRAAQRGKKVKRELLNLKTVQTCGDHS